MSGRTVRCPVPGCNTHHSRDLLMCRPHWRGLPRELRDAVWASFRGAGVLSAAYQDARKAAIDYHDPGAGQQHLEYWPSR